MNSRDTNGLALFEIHEVRSRAMDGDHADFLAQFMERFANFVRHPSAGNWAQLTLKMHLWQECKRPDLPSGE